MISESGLAHCEFATALCGPGAAAAGWPAAPPWPHPRLECESWLQWARVLIPSWLAVPRGLPGGRAVCVPVAGGGSLTRCCTTVSGSVSSLSRLRHPTAMCRSAEPRSSAARDREPRRGAVRCPTGGGDPTSVSSRLLAVYRECTVIRVRVARCRSGTVDHRGASVSRQRTLRGPESRLPTEPATTGRNASRKPRARGRAEPSDESKSMLTLLGPCTRL